MVKQSNSVAHISTFECTTSYSLSELAADDCLVFKPSGIPFDNSVVIFRAYLKV